MAFPGQIGFERDGLALDYRIQEIGEGMKAVKLADLWRLKGRDPLWFVEEIYTIRRHKSMTPSFPPNKVNDELRPPARRAYASERTFGPRMVMKPFGFLILSFLTARVTLMMNIETLLRRIVIKVS